MASAKSTYPNHLLASFDSFLSGFIEVKKQEKFLSQLGGTTSYTVSPKIEGGVYFAGQGDRYPEWILPFYSITQNGRTVAYYVGMRLEFSSTVPSAAPEKVFFRFFLEKEIGQFALIFRAELDKRVSEHAQPHWHYDHYGDGGLVLETEPQTFQEIIANPYASQIEQPQDALALLSGVHYCMAWNAKSHSCEMDQATTLKWMKEILEYTRAQLAYAYRRT